MATLLKQNHAIQDFLTNGHAEVAELFAGTGQVSKAFARLGAKIVAVGDIDEDAQDMLKHEHPNAMIMGDTARLDPHHKIPTPPLSGGIRGMGYVRECRSPH